MASKEQKDVESALEALKAVAKNLHTPFDTSELERSVKALVRSAGSSSSSSSSSDNKDENKDKGTQPRPEAAPNK